MEAEAVFIVLIVVILFLFSERQSERSDFTDLASVRIIGCFGLTGSKGAI
jgi:hypothetical protein